MGRTLLQAWLLVACACAACGGKTETPPRFERVFAFDVNDDNAAVLEIAADGKRVWVGLSAGGLLTYAEPWGAATKISMRGTLTGAGRVSDGKVFVADREHVEIWDAALSSKQRELAIPAREPDLSRKRLALSSGERYLAVDDAVFDEQTGRWAFAPAGHGHQTALAFAGEAFVLTAGFHDQQLVVRDLAAGTQHLWQAPAPITAAALTQDAHVVAATEKAVVIWNPNTAAPSSTVEISGASDVRVCSRERVAVLAGRSVRVLDLPALRESARFDLDSNATALACDGTLLVAGDDAGNVHAWDLARARAIGSEHVLPAPINALALAGAARRVLAVANDERGAHAVLLHARP